MSDSCAPACAREISLGSWKSKKRRNVSLGGFVKLTGIPYRTLVKLIGIALAAVYYHDTCEAIEFLEVVWYLVLPLNKKKKVKKYVAGTCTKNTDLKLKASKPTSKQQ